MTIGSNKKSLMVTGASRRLGLLTCKAFLKKGYDVAAVTRAANDELNALIDKYPSSFEVCECKVYDEAGANRVVSKFEGRSFDILINNASYFVEDGDSAKRKVEQYQHFFETHMLFPMLLSDWFAEQSSRVPKDGTTTDRTIINMSDIYAVKPTSDRSLYCSTKAGLENLTQSLAIKFAPQIRVNAIQPGPLAFLPEHAEDEKAKVILQTPLAKEGGFNVIVQTIEYVIANQFLTGSSIKVDGGRSLIR